MTTDTLTITYRIKQGKKKPKEFDFHLDSVSGDLISEKVENPPAWTELEYRQCSHCPLDKTLHSHCPVALQLHRIIDAFHDTSSIDEVDLEVVTPERTISQTVELQRVIGSMVGLLSPTCGCPKTAHMKPMARFHLPLSSEEETLFRVTGMYLLSQQLMGSPAMDFAGLKAIYDDLHILNKAIATRLRGATESDSSKNAIALLDMYSNLVPMMIEDQLPELRQLFSAYEAHCATVALPAMAPPAMAKKIPKAKTADDLALEALMQDVSVDELESLLGTHTLSLAPVEGEKKGTGDKPAGRAVFKLSDD